MKSRHRRRFLKTIALTPIVLSPLPAAVSAMDCTEMHPFMPPRNEFDGQCPVCGMVRPMWARTWITFDVHQGVEQACSFHCLADWTAKTGRQPSNIMLAVYHEPSRMIPAEQAVVVLGSAAAGTMSPVSKIVFSGKAAATAFAETCSGSIVDFPQALAAAAASVAKENKMINVRRLEKGKIVEPSKSAECPVCNMRPARYPYGKCQLHDKDGTVLHFCSTQCMFAFLGKPTRYVDHQVTPFLMWVVDRNAGMWISARAAFYAVGSAKVFGPMGYEAFPFNSRREASDFVRENGGQVASFGEVTIHQVVPNWNY